MKFQWDSPTEAAKYRWGGYSIGDFSNSGRSSYRDDGCWKSAMQPWYSTVAIKVP